MYPQFTTSVGQANSRTLKSLKPSWLWFVSFNVGKTQRRVKSINTLTENVASLSDTPESQHTCSGGSSCGSKNSGTLNVDSVVQVRLTWTPNAAPRFATLSQAPVKLQKKKKSAEESNWDAALNDPHQDPHNRSVSDPAPLSLATRCAGGFNWRPSAQGLEPNGSQLIKLSMRN